MSSSIGQQLTCLTHPTNDSRFRDRRPRNSKLFQKHTQRLNFQKRLHEFAEPPVVLRSSFIETSHGASYQLNIVVPERCQSNEVLIPTNISFATTLWDVQALISQ